MSQTTCVRCRDGDCSRHVDHAERPCSICGTRFKPKTKVSTCCSTRCLKKKGRDNAELECEDLDCSKPVRAKKLCAYHYRLKFYPDSRSRWPEDPAKRRANLRRKTQLRRALLSDPDAESIDRDQVGIRDGWSCGLCGGRIDRFLAWPLPASPSLDHIIPLSRGGKHVATNVQISHLGCNMAKGNRGGGEQLMLIG